MTSIKSLIIAFICTISFNTNYAQSKKGSPLYKNDISITTGLSAIGGIVRVAGNISSTDSVSSYSIPAIQLNFDRSLAKLVSIGASVSYQRMGFNFGSLAYTDDNGAEQIANNVTVDFNRINFAGKFLLTYVHSQKIIAYSGLRIGVTQWISNSELQDADISTETGIESNIAFAPQLILFGMKGYFTDHFGAGMELALGSPHIVSVGISYRF